MMITPKEIDNLTKKLHSGQDITKKESFEIRKVFSDKSLKTTLNSDSDDCNRALLDSLTEWYYAVRESIASSKEGNFLNTIFLRPYKVCDGSLEYILRSCLSNPSLDNIDKTEQIRLFKKYADENFKKNTTKAKKNVMLYSYIFTFSFHGEIKRKGLYALIKDYAPVPFEEKNAPFEMRYDEIFSDDNCYYPVSRETLKQFFIGKAVYQCKINPITVRIVNNPITVRITDKKDLFLYIPKESLPLVKSWLKIPTEEIVKRMVSSPKVKKEEAEKLLKITNVNNCRNIPYYDALSSETVLIGAQIMMKLAEIKSDKERVRSEHIDEDLLEMIR